VNASVRARRGFATDIFIVGTGMKGVQHLTLEALGALRTCKTILTVDHGFGVVDYLRTLGPRVVDLIPEYRDGRHRLETYHRMAARVVEAALTNPPVAFAAYGHPHWLVFPTELIVEAAKLLDLNVTAIAGISSIDMLVLELGIDPAARGLQIFEATGVVANRIPITPTVPCVLLQVDAFRRKTFSTKRMEKKDYGPLVNYLGRIYPPSHKALSVYSSTHALMKPLTIAFPLRELADVYEKETVSGTIFIPPVHRRRRKPARAAR